MGFDGLPVYAFTPEGIREGAPDASGIYAIFTPTQWLVIADADNMREALYRLLAAPAGCLQSPHPLSFSCEGAPASTRHARLGALIEELRPKCSGSPGD